MKLAPAEHQAVEWEVRLREGDVGPTLLREFDCWRNAQPANEQAWNALQQRLSRLGGGRQTAAPAMAHALRTSDTERRRVLRAAFGMLVLGCGTWGIRAGVHALALDADWRSGTGELGEGMLADGTRLTYDAGSRIYLSRPTASPALELQQGQLLVKRSGNLRISTAHGTVDTEGATFSIGRLHARSLVAVSGGSVLLRPGSGRSLPVSAGEACYFDGAGGQMADLPFAAASAWTRGVCVADRMPLAELVEIFGRYRQGLLRVSGHAATLEVSGVFRLQDTGRALLQVTDILPVRLRHYGPYLTVLSAT